MGEGGANNKTPERHFILGQYVCWDNMSHRTTPKYCQKERQSVPGDILSRERRKRAKGQKGKSGKVEKRKRGKGEKKKEEKRKMRKKEKRVKGKKEKRKRGKGEKRKRGKGEK